MSSRFRQAAARARSPPSGHPSRQGMSEVKVRRCRPLDFDRRDRLELRQRHVEGVRLGCRTCRSAPAWLPSRRAARQQRDGRREWTTSAQRRRSRAAGWRGGKAGGLGRTDDATTQDLRWLCVGAARAIKWLRSDASGAQRVNRFSSGPAFDGPLVSSAPADFFRSQTGSAYIRPIWSVKRRSSADYTEITKQGRIDQRRGGGTGRRIGLKIRRSHKGRVGSIPAPGNHQSQVPCKSLVPSPSSLA